MGYWKQKQAEYEEQEHVAKRITIDAGAIHFCELPGSTFEGVEEPVAAYKLGNSRLSAGKLGETFASSREMTDLIKQVIEEQPERCPECVRFELE